MLLWAILITPPPTTSSSVHVGPRRAINTNRDLLGGNEHMVGDEKARTDFFVHTIASPRYAR